MFNISKIPYSYHFTSIFTGKPTALGFTLRNMTHIH